MPRVMLVPVPVLPAAIQYLARSRELAVAEEAPMMPSVVTAVPAAEAVVSVQQQAIWQEALAQQDKAMPEARASRAA